MLITINRLTRRKKLLILVLIPFLIYSLESSHGFQKPEKIVDHSRGTIQFASLCDEQSQPYNINLDKTNKNRGNDDNQPNQIVKEKLIKSNNQSTKSILSCAYFNLSEIQLIFPQHTSKSFIPRSPPLESC